MGKKPKILCVCSQGRNRSKYLASYLKNKGYSTRYGGVGFEGSGGEAENPIKQKDIDWADIIITVKKRHHPILRNNYKVKNKTIISLDVADSKRLVVPEHPELENLNYEEFQKKWTYPQLRKAIKPYLPLD